MIDGKSIMISLGIRFVFSFLVTGQFLVEANGLFMVEIVDFFAMPTWLAIGLDVHFSFVSMKILLLLSLEH